MFWPGRAQATEVWFAPTDNLARAGKLFNQDFPRLFDEPPAWNTDIDLFQIAPFYAEHATDEDLLRIASFLARRRIVLGAGVQPMQIDGECAGGEGRTRRGANLRIFQRLRKLGLDIRYIGLDEPLTFGHYASRGNRPCQFPIDDVARRVAATISEIRELYPLARIVDYEAPTIASVATWPAELAEWLDAYKRATGANLDAVAFDVDWRVRWLDWVRPGIRGCAQQGSSRRDAPHNRRTGDVGRRSGGKPESEYPGHRGSSATARSRHRRLLDAVPIPQLARVGFRHLDVGPGFGTFPNTGVAPGEIL